ncbi:MAG: energy transducer TonB [Opitutales bacterium]|nr:energy transducer TonB [Opitutales bacterium]
MAKKMPDPRQIPQLRREFPVSIGTGLIFAAFVLLALPISQLIDSFWDPGLHRVEMAELRPPPLVEEVPPAPEEDVSEDIKEIETPRQPPTLEQIAMSLHTDLSGFGRSDFTIPVWSMGSQLDEIIFELADLTRQPRPISQVAPVYPVELQRARVGGTVVLKFVVSSDGTTSRISVESSDHPGFEQPAITAVRRWRFHPGERDGKPVSCWVRIPIPFSVGGR